MTSRYEPAMTADDRHRLDDARLAGLLPTHHEGPIMTTFRAATLNADLEVGVPGLSFQEITGGTDYPRITAGPDVVINVSTLTHVDLRGFLGVIGDSDLRDCIVDLGTLRTYKTVGSKCRPAPESNIYIEFRANPVMPS
jgi:hypothetical protein